MRRLFDEYAIGTPSARSAEIAPGPQARALIGLTTEALAIWIPQSMFQRGAVATAERLEAAQIADIRVSGREVDLTINGITGSAQGLHGAMNDWCQKALATSTTKGGAA
jgi:hypothetical protein